MARSIILAIDVQATPTKTFEALTTAEGLRGFWTPDADAEPELGTNLRFGFAAAPVDLQMTVTALKPGERVEWECAGPWPYWEGTQVGWLIGEGNPTRVLFRHRGFDEDQPEAEFGSIAYTWAMVLSALKSYLETGVAAPALT